MESFRMNTDTVYTLGGNLANLADEFGLNKTKIDQIVNDIISSDYTSDDAKAIANEIKSYSPMLESIHAKLERHANFSMAASKQTARTQEDIISSVHKGN